MATASGKRKKRKPKGKADNPAQSRKFIEAAKGLGLDEAGEHFEKALQAMLKPKKPKRGSS